MTSTVVEIVVDRANFRRWHVRLRESLLRRAQDSLVYFRFAGGCAPWPAPVASVLVLEAILLRRSRPSLCDALEPTDAMTRPDGALAADVVIDLTGADAAAGALRLLFNGCADEMAAVAALLADACPNLAVAEDDGTVVATGLPSLEAAAGLTGKLENIYSRAITLFEQALLSPRRVLPAPVRAPADITPRLAIAFVVRSAMRLCEQKIRDLCCHAMHWRVGWRLHDGAGVVETGGLEGAPWRTLADDANCFSADPFPIQWRGRTFIFYERLDYRSGKGVIFAQEFDAAGPIGEAFLALEEPWHLSYPFLFVSGDELYMLPEASLSGAVTLYKSVYFPRRWEPVARLLDNIEAADATIFEHGGRYWMTSVTREGVGGYSDTLAIHHAHNFLGPWEQHARRPALVDARHARPAGAIVHRDGALLRPVQDCSEGYGRRLAIMRIDRLDPENFDQTQLCLIEPGRSWPGDRLHTLNRSGRLECVDGAIFTPRPMALRRLAHAAIDRRSRSASS